VVGSPEGRASPPVGSKVGPLRIPGCLPAGVGPGVGPEVGLSVGSRDGNSAPPVGCGDAFVPVGALAERPSVGSLTPPVGCGDAFIVVVEGLFVADSSRGLSVGSIVGVLSLHHCVGLSVGLYAGFLVGP